MPTQFNFLKDFKWNSLVVALLVAVVFLLALAATQQPAWARTQESRSADLAHVSQAGIATGEAQGSTTGDALLRRAPVTWTGNPGIYVYTVRAGDSWIAISQRFGTTYSELREINAELWTIRGVVIRPGDEMAIPTLSAAQVGPSTNYVVAPGDSWYKIADTYGVSFWDLRSDNPALWARRGEYIRPGDEMIIKNIPTFASRGTDPARSVASTAPAAPSAVTLPSTEVGMPVPVHQLPEGATLYVVRPGDSWFRIAATYGIEFEKLRSANQNLWLVRGQALRVGDQMVIPPHGTPPPPIDIRVVPGEPADADEEAEDTAPEGNVPVEGDDSGEAELEDPSEDTKE
jgi:LysM repeat protein